MPSLLYTIRYTLTRRTPLYWQVSISGVIVLMPNNIILIKITE